jgi:hypothetical protein
VLSGPLHGFSSEPPSDRDTTTTGHFLCCCPKSITLANDAFVPPEMSKGQMVYGNEFDVLVEVTMIEAHGKVQADEPCTLEWWEKCDDPPGVFGEGNKPKSNQWYLASSLLPHSGTIEPWRKFEENSKQKGPTSITMTDKPVQLAGKDRTLLFDITVRKPADCPCGLVEGENPYVHLKATQTLKAKGKNGGPEGKVTEGWPEGETGPP